jgi:hypothetical protein
MPFAALGLSPVLCPSLARLGFTRPTPVQSQSIPLILSGRDLVARAQTGTGKTAAFGLPMIERLLVRERRSRQPRRPRGLILVPTRELAIQVDEAVEVYGAPVQVRAIAVYGGAPMSRQVRALHNGTDIIVATPGRLLDHMRQRTIDLSGVEILTLDEADRMLDLGFKPALRRILEVLPRTRQTLLFSATLSSEVVHLATTFTREPLRVDVSDGHVVASTVTHRRPQAGPADTRSDGVGWTGAGLLPNEARLESSWRVPGGGRRRLGGHSRQQESSGADPRAERFQGAAGHRTGRHRHRGARHRHRALAPGDQLRSAHRPGRLRPPCRTDRSRGDRRVRNLIGVEGGRQAAARYPAAAANAARASRRRWVRVDAVSPQRHRETAAPSPAGSAPKSRKRCRPVTATVAARRSHLSLSGVGVTTLTVMLFTGRVAVWLR